MTPTLIVLALLALGVGIVAFATRQPPVPTVPAERDAGDQDTAWNDPVTPDGDHPFAHVPEPSAPPAAGTPPAKITPSLPEHFS
jgi:hypothetical protein